MKIEAIADVINNILKEFIKNYVLKSITNPTDSLKMWYLKVTSNSLPKFQFDRTQALQTEWIVTLSWHCSLCSFQWFKNAPHKLLKRYDRVWRQSALSEKAWRRWFANLDIFSFLILKIPFAYFSPVSNYRRAHNICEYMNISFDNGRMNASVVSYLPLIYGFILVVVGLSILPRFCFYILSVCDL